MAPLCRARPKRERPTVDGYRKIVEHRLLPEFGDRLLEEIDVYAAERWRMSLVQEGLSANLINKVRWSAEAVVKRAMPSRPCLHAAG